MKLIFWHKYRTILFVPLLFLWSSFAIYHEEVSEPENEPTARPSISEVLNYKVNKSAIESAIIGYKNLQKKGHSFRENLVVIDYSKSGNDIRFFVINMSDTTLTHSLLVAHGRNTGELFAMNFSNEVGSYKSSLGFFKTAETYSGKHGLSLRLDGLEKGINDKARDRAIVIHRADYVSYDFISEHGRLGRSHGCPALPVENYEEVINTIKNGCLLFIYGDQDSYTDQTALLASN